jgi:P4 family phage/plasmid primase-like protien
MQQAAVKLCEKGIAIIWIKEGKKTPSHSRWSMRSQTLWDYQPGNQLGILPGALSGGLVCIDLDNELALSKADDPGMLPATTMIEGRPGKPRSHRYYIVVDIPVTMASKTAAGGIGGPPNKHFLTQEGKGGIDFLGTGSCVVAPPSMHPTGEQRTWDIEGEPAIVDFVELWGAVCRLATDCGLKIPKVASSQNTRTAKGAEPSGEAYAATVEQLDTGFATEEDVEGWQLVPLPHRITRCRAYLDKVDAAVSGQGGHHCTWRIAKLIVNDFAIDDRDHAQGLLQRFNERGLCQPPWSEDELLHKLDGAFNDPPDAAFPKGCKLRDANGQASTGEDFDDPDRLARSFRATTTWRYWRQEFWKYTGECYVMQTEETVLACLWKHVKREFDKVYLTMLKAAQKAHAKQAAVATALNKEPPEFKAPTVPQVSKKTVANVLAALQSQTIVDDSITQPSMLPDGQKPELVAVKNGLLNLRTKKLSPHTPEWFSSVCLSYRYEAGRKSTIFLPALKYLQEYDPARVKLLIQWLGYLLIESTDEQQFLICVGGGNNGKSTYFAAAEALIGSANVSHVPLHKFGGEFALWPTIGKLANICAECAGGPADEQLLKAYTSGDPININRKNLSFVKIRPSARLMFSVNEVPTFKDTTDGFWRRPLFVPFNVKISKDKRSKGMDKVAFWEASGDLPGILNLALEGLDSLRAEDGFAEPEVCRRLREDYRRESNTPRAFLEDNYCVVKDLSGDVDVKSFIPRTDVYNAFVTASREQGYRDKDFASPAVFGKEVKRLFGGIGEKQVRRMDGSGKRVWVYIGLCQRAEDKEKTSPGYGAAAIMKGPIR